jgi:uncharacterized lipoprotein YddW (UPF0748 family)
VSVALGVRLSVRRPRGSIVSPVPLPPLRRCDDLSTAVHPATRLAVGILLPLLTVIAGASPALIDSAQYADDAAAQAAWRPMKDSAPAAVGTVHGRTGLRLRCNFAGTRFERASWDRAVTVNLAAARGVRFDFFCPDPSPIGQYSIYLQSGAGWYSATFQPEAGPAWGTITVNKSAFRTEGQPAGWHQISTVRISAWRARNTDTEIWLSNLRRAGVLGVDANVAILRAESIARANPGEARSVDQFTQSVASGFEAFGIGTSIPGDLELTPAWLQDARLVVLPYNPTLPPEATRALLGYLERGGRLLAFYQLPAELRAAVGIETGGLLKSEGSTPRFASIRFAPGALPGAPETVHQRSWNIRAAKPAPTGGRVLAEWFDAAGQPAGEAAIIATPNCVLMTHVLLADDLVNQRRMLLAMAGQLAPELWREGVAAAVAKIGHVGANRDFDSAVSALSRQPGAQPRVAAALAAVRESRDRALELGAAGNFAGALDAATLASRRMLEAFCLAQTSAPGEFRAFWCHSAFGVDGMDWDEAIRRLAAAGFTAILPNMLWGGVAYYPSKVLPVAADVGTRGDQIAQCLAAGRKYGIQVHVWKVNWNTGHRVPAEFLDRMRTEGRLQVSATGKVEPWLCPSHPENQALELASMLEVAREYDVDGIHFDYIRYPGGDHCFCPGCRERFGKSVGAEIRQWPQDALGNGPWRAAWLEWRRSNISAVVQAISEQAHALKPQLKVSAAVFRNWATDRDGVGQDWKVWCERGWLDFVCPMDYTNSEGLFENWVELQKGWAGRTPVYPGIGVSSSTSRLPPDRVINQIAITRRHGTGGFTLFNYGVVESRELLPLLHLGATAKR